MGVFSSLQEFTELIGERVFGLKVEGLRKIIDMIKNFPREDEQSIKDNPDSEAND